MNNSLAPTYSFLYGEYWVLWYNKSNSYSIIDCSFKSVLDLYLDAKTEDDFLKSINLVVLDQDAQTIIAQIKTYLNSCNVNQLAENFNGNAFDPTNRNFSKTFFINNKAITLYCDPELVLNTVYPQLAHLESNIETKSDLVFDIYIKNDYLYLFKNESCILKTPKVDYHFLQGKFILYILCEFHNKKEEDWLGTFHGSAVTDDNTAILFIGESGSGKSTLSTLLASNGYYLLADDVSPMLAEDTKIYFNPNGISIKESASSVLIPIIKNFDSLPTINLSTKKGPVRYYSPVRPPQYNYPCKSIVLVNYKPNAKNILEEVSIKTILETLIPESWLSPNPIHAKLFMDYLKTIKFYKLTYSDNNTMLGLISNLFEAQS